jgi:uncharacterized peroxidase-related enzyme
MGYLGTIDEGDARTDVQRMYAADRERQGYVSNYTRTFSLHPSAYAGWLALNGAIKGGMDLRRYELATMAAARRLRSSYCSMAHGKTITEQGMLGMDDLGRLMRGEPVEGLSEEDRQVVELAHKVAGEAADITEADLQPLRDLGLEDADILDVILAAAARCFFSTVLDATGTAPDAALVEHFPRETLSVLAVGRPVAAGDT